MNQDSSSKQSSNDGPIVFVIDDEEPVRVALSSLFRSIDIRVETFATPAEFLEKSPPDIPSCLVLDVRLKGLSGLDFQHKLVESNTRIPVIFMTGHGDIAMAIQAMKAGAVDFLVKPFRDQDLLDAVSAAHQIDTRRRESEKQNAEMHACFLTLTPREREVMIHAAKGLMNKQIAGEMDLSEVTVKIHRGHVMKKMRAKSFADLVRMAESLRLGQKR